VSCLVNSQSAFLTVSLFPVTTILTTPTGFCSLSSPGPTCLIGRFTHDHHHTLQGHVQCLPKDSQSSLASCMALCRAVSLQLGSLPFGLTPTPESMRGSFAVPIAGSCPVHSLREEESHGVPLHHQLTTSMALLTSVFYLPSLFVCFLFLLLR
jgi:hypothetical protein